MELNSRHRAMLQEMGVHVFLPPPAVLGPAPTPTPMQRAAPAAPVAPVVAAAAARVVPASPPAAAGGRAPDAGPQSTGWQALHDSVHACQDCGLCSTRRHSSLRIVPDALACDWLVVGDPPDDDEDHSGQPFAARHGVLLGNMLRALDVHCVNLADAPEAPTQPARRAYATNVVKCRPAHGRIVQTQELLQCAAHLDREIALLRPRVIVALGRFAIQLLLRETPELTLQPLGKLRGTLHAYRGIPVVVSYHPMVLMRNAADKARAWADLCLAADAADAADAVHKE